MKSLGTTWLSTERLTLRRFVEDDIQSTYDNYGSDPKTWTYISFAPCSTLEGTKGFVHMHMRGYLQNPDFYGWAITLDGVIIGSIALFDVDTDDESAEIGYTIGSRWWGKGYATEAVKAVVDFALHEVGFHRIQATYNPENKASEKVLQKAGLRYEGIMRDGQRNFDGSFTDLKLCAILSTD